MHVRSGRYYLSQVSDPRVKAPRKHIARGRSSGLGELLAMGLNAKESWTAEELEAAFAEQISLPVEFELARLGQRQGQALREQAEAHGLLVKSLYDLFVHPHPPIDLLIMIKDFFKANSNCPHPGLPAEVACVLYYQSIAVAWLRYHRRISSLSEEQLADGFKWVSNRDWVGRDLQDLVKQAARSLGDGMGGTPGEK